LLASQDKDWTELAKMALGVILAYSLFYLYGGPWAKERWSRTNLFFFTDGTHIPLRLFLSSDPQKVGGPLHDPDGHHKYPEFLELGVILLEIHLGKKLESYLGSRQTLQTITSFGAVPVKYSERGGYIFSQQSIVVQSRNA
jgi:hypothetical protein